MPVLGAKLSSRGAGTAPGQGKSGGESSGIRGSGGRVSTMVAKESFELADERKFHALRKRLTDEGYTQALGFESVPLVHRLFDDMCALRDTHATLAHSLSEKSANEAKLQRQIHPVQKELSRMVRENNQLHLELIQRGEELDSRQRQETLDTKKLQTKIADQAFIITQQAQHIRDLEKQLDEQRQRIEELLDPNFTYTSGPAGETLPKGQEIMVSACPRPHDVQLDDEDGDGVEQVAHDLESATAKHIAVLEEDLKEANRKQELMELQAYSLKEAIKNRENEILRMGRLLVNNVNSDREDLEVINSTNEDSIRRLNSQLDFVSGQLADAEQQKIHMQQLQEEVELLRRNEAKLREMLADAQSELQELRSVLAQQCNDSIETSATVKKGGISSGDLIELLDKMSSAMHLLDQLQLNSKQQQWNAIFKGLDKNGDNRISKGEWKQALKKKFKPVSDEDAALLFDIFDSDGSGELDIREFHVKTGETHHEPTRRALVRELAKRAQVPVGDSGQGEGAAGEEQRATRRDDRDGAAQQEDLSVQIDALEAALRQRDAECARLREQVVLGQQKLGEALAKSEQVGGELAEMKRLRDNLYAVVWDFENQMAEVQVKIKELVTAREEKSRECAEALEQVKALEHELAAGARASVRAHARGTLEPAAASTHAAHVAQLLEELKSYRARVQDLESQVDPKPSTLNPRPSTLNPQP
jgi:Ca2+-binding EF-hand superfamily protein